MSLPDRITPVTQAMFDETYGQTFVSGASLICSQILLVLYGLATLQTYMYFMNYTRDPKSIKLTVLWIWLLSTLHAAFISHTEYHYLAKSYSDPMLLIDGEWSVYSGIAVGVAICFCVQVFFARMIFCLTNGATQRMLAVSFAVLIMAHAVFGIYISYDLFHLWEIPALHAAVYRSMVPLLIIRVVSDALTAGTLCVILYDSKSFARSLKLLNTLIVYSMNRFILTTLVVIVQTIILLKRPRSIWAMAIEFITAQLYVNSFLASLNSRNRLRHIGNSNSISLSYIQPSSITPGNEDHPGELGQRNKEDRTSDLTALQFRRRSSLDRSPTNSLEWNGDGRTESKDRESLGNG
ncbi:hypothetical protein ONZ45_g5750 [Pleurotus djamor]|nr:hypothetical protein ONZ45_g5750 [Pleurotus djamor]